MSGAIADYRLHIALTENVAGVFTLNSPLDGSDALTDTGLFTGTYDDVTDDVDGSSGYQLVVGTDNLMSAIQPANLTCTVARVDDPGFWNPANPSSPVCEEVPGLGTPMRPVKLTATTEDGTEYVLFRGFLCRATWNSQTRGCELYAEDVLRWASRVYPVIDPTGPIRVGDVVKLLFNQVDPMLVCDCDEGILLDDFTAADDSQNVPQLLTDILTVDLGTVFIRGDGTPVYRQNSSPLAAPPTATFSTDSNASQEQTGIDVDDVGTRITVTKTDQDGNTVGTWTSINAVAERRSGRADISPISSSYVQNGQALADELVLQGIEGKPPMQVATANVDDDTFGVILTSEPLTVYTVDDDFAGTSGDGIAQQITHTIRWPLHQATLLMKARKSKAFTLNSALDGPDKLRYP